MGMAKFCQETHYILPLSLDYVDFLALRPSLLHHHKSRGFDSVYFKADDLVMLIMLQIILIFDKRGCSIAFGS